MPIKKLYLIEKRNILNEMKTAMKLQELRFLCIYLARIDARRRDETRVVKFPMNEFARILEIKDPTIPYFKKTTNALLQKIIHVPHEKYEIGWRAFQLFKECQVYQEDGEWVVEIDAHDRALPLMFEFKDNYISYNLGNVLNLKSANHIRMYEILKQWQGNKVKVFSLAELKEKLGMENSNERWSNFTRVLESSKQALKEHTDITFTYRPIKKGKAGKVVSVQFVISANENFSNKLGLDEFVGAEMASEIDSLDTSNKPNYNELMKDELWEYAFGIAEKVKATHPKAYAAKVLKAWKSKGYRTPEDLIKAKEITKPKKDTDEYEWLENDFTWVANNFEDPEELETKV